MNIKYRFILSENENHLPIEYQRLDSITGDVGLSFVDTGVEYDLDTSIELDYKDNQWKAYGNSGAICGPWKSGSSSIGVIYGSSNDNRARVYPCVLSNQYMAVSGFTSATRHTVIIDRNGISLDGSFTQNTRTVAQVTDHRNILIGKAYIPTTTPSAPDSREMTIYSCVIRKNGSVVFDGVPCRRKSDGVVGLYDRVTKRLVLPYYDTGVFRGGSVVNESSEVRPVWKDDMALDYQREGEELFMRRELSSSLDFIREDYALIMGTAFDTEHFLEIEASDDNGATWTAYYTGRFMITDCTIDADHHKVTVKPQVWDRYNAILAGMEKEYDLIKLAPAIQPVTVTRRPVIQVYVAGEEKLTNVLSAMSWEQDAESSTDHDHIIEDWHFQLMGSQQEIVFQNAPAGLGGTFIGSFDHWTDEGEWHDFDNGEGVYWISTVQEVTIIPDVGGRFMKALRIFRYSDNALIWEWKDERIGGVPDVPSPCTFSAIASGFSDVTMTWAGTRAYGRMLLATDTYQHGDVYEVPAEDITAANRNYRYCTPYGFSGSLTMTSAHQSEPTEWGVRPDGTYYTKPEPSLTDYGFIPVGRSMWLYASLWFVQNSLSETLEEGGRKETQINDMFSLEGVINALLKEIDPTVTFAATTDYSVFLYGTNPLVPASSWGRLMMTPKSNILVAEYTMPARKAPCTLKAVLDMLRTCCGLYWFIDDANRLRIEHVTWFKNGGSYDGSHTVGIDLTQMVNPRNGKAWSYNTSVFSWDKVDMAERYQFGWMDDSTTVFAGFPLDVRSKYVTEGRIEEETVPMFNADIDYLMLNPSNVSADGFALLCCRYTNGKWRTDIASGLRYNGMYYTLQNFQLAFAQLTPSFLISDMPAWHIVVNGAQIVSKGIQRKKQQQVTVPCGKQDPDTNALVRTEIGDGEILKMSVRLTSRISKMTLVYDTEEQQP